MSEQGTQQEFIKCPGCECLFLTVSDRDKHVGKFGYGKHIDAFRLMHRRIEMGSEENDTSKENQATESTWRKSKYDDGEIDLAEKYPIIAMACRSQGKLENAQYRYVLCGKDNLWLKRYAISSCK